MELKFAKTNDAEQLAEIDQTGNKEIKGWDPNSKSDFIKNITQSRDSIIIAKENDKIIGYLSSRPDKDSKWLWLEDIYVLKEWRKKGVAGNLIKKLVEYKKKKMSKRKLVLLTVDRNVKIFKKLGFKKIMSFMEYNK